MPGTEEKPNTWRHRIRDPSLFDEFRTKTTSKGVDFVFGKYKGKPGWAMQSIVFDKDEFKTSEEVNKWLSTHKINEQASAPIDDVKLSSDYDLILTYEEAIQKPCLIGLAKYVPELEARGYDPEEGRKVLLEGSTPVVEEEPDQDKRSVLYAIGKKEEGHRTKPPKYKHIPDSQFADPVNYKYPLDCEHVQAAWSFLHVGSNKSDGGYSDAEWSAMNTKAKRAMKACGHQVTAQAMSYIATLLQDLSGDFS